MCTPSRHWYPRLLCALWAGHIPLVTWLTPESMGARLLAQAGMLAHVFMVALAFMAMLALLDVAINDLLPDRFHLPIVDHRHIGYMGMALCLLMLTGFVGTRAGPSPILLAYVLPALASIGVTWLDLTSRHQQRRMVPAVP